MYLFHKKIILTIFLGLVFWTEAQDTYRSSTTSIFDMVCRIHGLEEVTDTKICTHGAATNRCGKLSCLRGVGDKCGSGYMHSILQGECASGLMCCGTCVGCKNGKCDSRLCRTREPDSTGRQFNMLDNLNFDY